MSSLKSASARSLKKYALLGVSLGLASAIVAAPAFAASDALGGVTVTIGEIAYQIRFGTSPASIGHVNVLDDEGSGISFSTTSHLNGQLGFNDGTIDWFAPCVRETATDTVTSGDTIIDCLPARPNNAYSALEVTTQYRIFAPDANGVTVARMLYKVHNPTASDVTVQTLKSSVEWDFVNESWNMYTNAGEKTEGAALPSSEVRWLNTFTYKSTGALDPDVTTFGSAWRSAGNAYFNDIVGQKINIVPGGESRMDLSSSQVTFKAGETSYFAFFSVYAYPVISGEDVVADTNAVMALFNQPFEGSALARGIPDGAKVLNWMSSAEPAPAPNADELAKTGSGTFGFLSLSALVIASGVGALLYRRRSAQR